jgi:hypothetical protein
MAADPEMEDMIVGAAPGATGVPPVACPAA